MVLVSILPITKSCIVTEVVWCGFAFQTWTNVSAAPVVSAVRTAQVATAVPATPGLLSATTPSTA